MKQTFLHRPPTAGVHLLNDPDPEMPTKRALVLRRTQPGGARSSSAARKSSLRSRRRAGS
jgi:hypothetical protein